MAGNKDYSKGLYNPFFNVKIYSELEELRDQGYITSLTINESAFKKDLNVTFNLTNQKIGDINHSYDFEKYSITIKRNNFFNEPVVFINYPELKPKTPHLNFGGHLCLFDPKRITWNEGDSIKDTIFSWTLLWVFYYETWLITGKWLGEEAPH